MKKKIFGITALLFLFACHSGSQSDELFADAIEKGASSGYEPSTADYELTEEANNSENKSESSIDPEPDESTEETNKLERKLIRTATLSFETDSMAVRRKMIVEATKKTGGYIESEEEFDSNNRKNVTVTIRVPSSNFDELIDRSSEGVGEFDTRMISTEDVSAEYIDVKARIKTKKEMKERFTDLLDMANTIQGIMEVEREINVLQSEIESYESRLRFLASNSSLSTVNITYYKTVDYLPVAEENRFLNAFSNGWSGVVLFILLLTNIWPFLVIGGIVWWIIVFRINRKKAVN